MFKLKTRSVSRQESMKTYPAYNEVNCLQIEIISGKWPLFTVPEPKLFL